MRISPLTEFICLLAALITVTTAFASEPTRPITPTSRMELFNRKDLSGWCFFLQSNTAPADTFTVTNGVIHCTGQPFGYARTENDFRNYKLTVEWRYVKIAPKADNTGIFVHVQGPDQIWPKCVENQGKNQRQGDFVLMSGATCKGHETPELRVVKTQMPPNEKAPGEWNTYEIVCRGDSVKNFVNGKLMNKAEGCNVTSGAIALQSEGGEWELRKIQLEPLP
ncbi:MAG: DUF1080 domain-containing protein [Verrucomicrobiota bacterium]